MQTKTMIDKCTTNEMNYDSAQIDTKENGITNARCIGYIE